MLKTSQELLSSSLSRLLNFIHEPMENRQQKLQDLLIQNSSCSIPGLIESPSSSSLLRGVASDLRRRSGAFGHTSEKCAQSGKSALVGSADSSLDFSPQRPTTVLFGPLVRRSVQNQPLSPNNRLAWHSYPCEIQPRVIGQEKQRGDPLAIRRPGVWKGT